MKIIWITPHFSPIIGEFGYKKVKENFIWDKQIEKLISDKKLKNFILHGKKTGKDLINFYKNADIFILTSDIEAMPLVS